MNLVNGICAQFIGIGGAMILLPLSVYTHELGHANMYRLLFKHAEPVITLEAYGYSGGSCKCDHLLPYSDFACFLGFKNNLDNRIGRLKKVMGIVLAAGPLTDITMSIALRCLFPNSGIVSGVCLVNDLKLARYALDSFKDFKSFYNGSDSWKQGDFIDLRNSGGMLPAVALITASVAFGAFSVYDFLRIAPEFLDATSISYFGAFAR